MTTQAQAGNSRFEIRLDPPELGRIDVRLDVDKNGQVTSHLTVDKVETFNMLQRDAPHLQRALEDAGLKTGDSGLQFSLRDQSSFSSNSRGDDGSSGRNPQRLVIHDDDNTVPTQVAGRSYGRAYGAAGGVDIRV
nr:MULTISPECIES: flagellar hook-length control protein FliK [unclassified Bradyrhizobium]